MLVVLQTYISVVLKSGSFLLFFSVAMRPGSTFVPLMRNALN